MLSQKKTYVCDCGEVFDRFVWHCKVCDHHWLPHVELCRNCYKCNRPPVARKKEKEVRRDK